MATWPLASTPCTRKIDFAISRPIILTACMFGSSKSWGLNSTHLHGTHVPVQEPSTASIADMCGAARDVRYGPIADICQTISLLPGRLRLCLRNDLSDLSIE